MKNFALELIAHQTKMKSSHDASSSHDDHSEKLFAMQHKMHSTTMQDDMRDDV